MAAFVRFLAARANVCFLGSPGRSVTGLIVRNGPIAGVRPSVRFGSDMLHRIRRLSATNEHSRRQGIAGALPHCAGAIAGMLNLDDPGPAVLAHLLKQLEKHRVLVAVLSARRE